MVANPNSNLVFDFPDPTPRFEFNDSPRGSPNKGGGGIGGGAAGGSSSPAKKGKRFGKFGRDKNKGSSPSSKSSLDGSSATATTTSVNTSLNSSLDHSLNNSLNHNLKGSPKFTKSHSGDIAAGPSQNGPLASGGLNFTLESSGPSSSKLNLPSNKLTLSGNSPGAAANNQHRRYPSSTNSITNNSTSGYISEVSEFSFDRVTVTTNETGVTGQSSNVSWNFMSEDVLNAVGAAGGGQKEGDSKFMPYTGDTAVVLATNMATANAELDNSRKTTKRGHGKKPSNSTFDNVSLSDDEEMDNIPFTGIVNDSAQSVISEISERTGGALGGEGTNDAVKALLREGMESARAKHHADRMKSNDRANSLMIDTNNNNKSSGKDSPSRETTETAKITDPDASDNNSDNKSSSKDLLQDLQETYTRFKTRRSNGGQKEKSSILQSIMEDVQFCGLYFCGIDTTNDKTMGYDDLMKKNKETRKREVDDTFLGKVIRCGNDMNCAGSTGAFCAAL